MRRPSRRLARREDGGWWRAGRGMDRTAVRLSNDHSNCSAGHPARTALGYNSRLMRTITLRMSALLAAVTLLMTPAAARQAAAPAPPQPQGAAQPQGAIDPALYSGMTWRSIGPDRGGRSIAVAGSNARPNEYYFGAVGGGVWKSDDFGNTWQPVSDKFFMSSSVGALAVAPSNPDVVYAGMGESCFRGNIIQGDGVYKTTDAGKTWQSVGLADDRDDQQDTRPPGQSGRRLDRRARPRVRSQRRARHLPHEGRRENVGAGALPQQQDRRDRPVARSEEPGCDVRVALGGLPHAAFDGKRRAGQRALQVHRRRHDLEGADRQPGPAKRTVGQKRRLRVRRRQQSRLRHRRERQRRGLRLRRRRRDVEGGGQRSQAPAARVLLHAHPGRHDRQGPCVRAERPVLAQRRRRQDLPDPDPSAAWRQPRPVDRAERQPADGAGQRRRRQRVGQRRQDLVGPGIRDRPVLQRLHDEARALSRLRRTAGQQHRLHLERDEPGGGRRQPAADLLFAGRRGERLHRSRSERRGRVLRRELRRPPHAPRSRDGSAPGRDDLSEQPHGALLDRHQGAVPVDVPDRVLAARSESALRVLTASLQDDQRRPELAADQPRSHAPRSRDDAGLRRTDYQGPDRRRDLRDDLHDCPVAPGAQHDLDRLGRRRHPRHAGWGQELGERHAEGHARVHTDQPDRGVATSERRRIRRRQPVSARRSQAVHLQDGRLRQDLDDDRRAAFRRTTFRGPSAKIRSAAGCCSSAPRTASTCRSTTGRAGSRCGSTFPPPRSMASSSRTAIW